MHFAALSPLSLPPSPSLSVSPLSFVSFGCFSFVLLLPLAYPSFACLLPPWSLFPPPFFLLVFVCCFRITAHSLFFTAFLAVWWRLPSFFELGHPCLHCSCVPAPSCPTHKVSPFHFRVYGIVKHHIQCSCFRVAGEVERGRPARPCKAIKYRAKLSNKGQTKRRLGNEHTLCCASRVRAA